MGSNQILALQQQHQQQQHQQQQQQQLKAIQQQAIGLMGTSGMMAGIAGLSGGQGLLSNPPGPPPLMTGLNKFPAAGWLELFVCCLVLISFLGHIILELLLISSLVHGLIVQGS